MTTAAARLARPTERADRKIFLVQGEFRVSDAPGLVVTTTLGSCVACCLYDAHARVGGINHFLLPHGEAFEGPDAIRYGAHAMELLINGLLHAGARKSRLTGKLFGGARLSLHLPDVGGANAAFAERFLQHEGIPHLGGSLRGASARRIEFWPETGRVRQREISSVEGDVLRAERVVRPAAPDDGSIEFFGD
jgi:chemotaxis protein CheD